MGLPGKGWRRGWGSITVLLQQLGCPRFQELVAEAVREAFDEAASLSRKQCKWHKIDRPEHCLCLACSIAAAIERLKQL